YTTLFRSELGAADHAGEGVVLVRLLHAELGAVTDVGPQLELGSDEADEAEGGAQVVGVEVLGDLLEVVVDAQLSVHHDGAAVAELVADVEADRVGHVVPAVHVDRLDLPLAVDARRAGLLEALLEELDRVGEGGTQAQRTATRLEVEGQLGLVAVADGENAELVVGGAVGADETLRSEE